jgi:hypothetical protein
MFTDLILILWGHGVNGKSFTIPFQTCVYRLVIFNVFSPTIMDSKFELQPKCVNIILITPQLLLILFQG